MGRMNRIPFLTEA